MTGTMFEMKKNINLMSSHGEQMMEKITTPETGYKKCKQSGAP